MYVGRDPKEGGKDSLISVGKFHPPPPLGTRLSLGAARKRSSCRTLRACPSAQLMRRSANVQVSSKNKGNFDYLKLTSFKTFIHAVRILNE